MSSQNSVEKISFVGHKVTWLSDYADFKKNAYADKFQDEDKMKCSWF